jgi:hypothetical protein
VQLFLMASSKSLNETLSLDRGARDVEYEPYSFIQTSLFHITGTLSQVTEGRELLILCNVVNRPERILAMAE